MNHAARRSGSARRQDPIMIPLLFALACASTSAGCSGDDAGRSTLTAARQAAPALSPLTDTITAPASALRAAIDDFMVRAGAQPSLEYSVARLDLDGDGVEEGLVLLTGTDWCGSAGCTLLVFHGDAERFRLVSETSMVNGPVVVAPARSNGWRDILVPDPSEDRTVALRFNGASYPNEPAGPAAVSTEGDTVFEGEIGLF
jgi:hypothetical protein